MTSGKYRLKTVNNLHLRKKLFFLHRVLQDILCGLHSHTYQVNVVYENDFFEKKSLKHSVEVYFFCT